MKIKLFILFLLMPMMAFAQFIDENDAREIAASALKKNITKGKHRIPSASNQGSYEIIDSYLELHRVVKDIDGEFPCYYIYNQKGGGKGFAIVSNQGQLLAHSDCCNLDYDNAPDNLKWLLEQYRRFLSPKYSEPYPEDDPSDKIDGIPSLYRHSIEPMVGSEWFQDSPFNNLIREKYEASGAVAEEIYAGCTTIAMAQTMFYWKHPQHGTGTKQFKLGNSTYTVDFEEPIDWNHIGPSPYWKPSTPEALADLSYRVAASLDSKVEDGSTFAYANDITKAMPTYFDYDSSIRDESSIFFSSEVYEDMAYSELEQGRPCIIYGQDGWLPLVSAGHTMMVEGYDAETNHYFINMGWGATPEGYEPANAYYALTVKNGYHEYIVFQHIITHIYPQKGGSAKPKIYARTYTPTYQVSRRVTEPAQAESAKNYHVSAQIFSDGMDANIVAGMKAMDFVTGQECLFEGPVLNLTKGALKNMDFDLDLSMIEYNGYYQLYPVFRMPDDDEWFTIWIQPENEQDLFQPTYVDVTDAKVLDLGKEIDFTLEKTTLEPGTSLQIDYKLPIKGVSVNFISSDPSIISVDDNGYITANQSGEATITAHCDDYYFNGNRLVKETTRVFQIICREMEIDHQVNLVFFFPYNLESDKEINIRNHIYLTPAYQYAGFSTEIEYTLGFFRDGKLVKKGYIWRGEYMEYNRGCEYHNLEYLEWHRDLEDGEYEIRLLYRVKDLTPEGEFWVMPTRWDDNPKVFMKLDNGHASFTQINRHPCELRVDGFHMSMPMEIGLKNSITVDIARISNMDNDGYSDVFLYVDGVYKSHNILDMNTMCSTSYVASVFAGTPYYFTPESAGPYNFTIVDGRHHILYDENIEFGEGKNYQLRVNNVVFHNSTEPNKVNNSVQIELEIENIGEYTFNGDVVCRPVPKSGRENKFYAPRFNLDIAPGEIVKQILPMDFDYYFSFADTEYIIVKCYYTSNGKDTILWESEKLTYLDPSFNEYIDADESLRQKNQKIYNLQGVEVGTQEHFDQLPAGLYLVGGNKILKK